MDTSLDVPWSHGHSADDALVVGHSADDALVVLGVAMVIDVASSRAEHDHRQDFVAKSDSILRNHVGMVEVAS